MTRDRRKSRGVERRPHARRTNGPERRVKDRRIDSRIDLQLWVEEGTPNELCYRRVANLSPGGLKLDHGFPHRVGTQVRLRFRLPREDHLFDVSAVVVAASWVDGAPVTNLQFVDLSGDDHIRISRYIEMVDEPTVPS